MRMRGETFSPTELAPLEPKYCMLDVNYHGLARNHIIQFSWCSYVPPPVRLIYASQQLCYILLVTAPLIMLRLTTKNPVQNPVKCYLCYTTARVDTVHAIRFPLEAPLQLPAKAILSPMLTTMPLFSARFAYALNVLTPALL